jgi:hypothetical protein
VYKSDVAVNEKFIPEEAMKVRRGCTGTGTGNDDDDGRRAPKHLGLTDRPFVPPFESN